MTMRMRKRMGLSITISKATSTGMGSLMAEILLLSAGSGLLNLNKV